MTRKSKDKTSEIDFKEVYKAADDEQIMLVLKRRKLYQEAAAKAAINEAVERGLINSEQDLMAEEYRHEPLKFSMFPEIENQRSRIKMRKSLTRSLLFLGAIIIVWGAWQLFQYNFNEGIGFIAAGIVWGLISYSFFKSVTRTKINLLFAIQGVAAVYAIFKLATQKNFAFIDLFILVVLFGFVLYGLLYLRKLRG
ncbi:MAG: hypothetical protein JXR61_09635 [Prolixibacteraceae bacterium]|nr:hypothetical protein [Prolixibacteraceae bacterium]